MLNPIGLPEECENCGTFIQELTNGEYLCQDCYEISLEESKDE